MSYRGQQQQLQSQTKEVRWEGLLITTDVPTKELILYINSLNNGKIVRNEDLNDTQVLIDPQYYDMLMKEIDRLYDLNTYQRS